MTQVLDIYAEIAELDHCILTREERAETLRRLEAERRERAREGA